MGRADAVVMTVNGNEKYMYWLPFVCSHWAAIGIDPHVYLIGKVVEPAGEELKSCTFHHVEIPSDWSEVTFAQVSRVLIPATLTAYKNVMISDIDSIPIDGPYWASSGGEKPGTFVNMRRKSGKTAMMGFNSAAPSTWKRVFGPAGEDSVVDAMRKWRAEGKWQDGAWNADQQILSRELSQDTQVVYKNPEVYKALFNERGQLLEQNFALSRRLWK